jgi:transposase
MEIRGVDKGQIKAVCMDLSPAYISAVSNQFPLSVIVFDRFHLTSMLNKAVDEVRREDQKKNAVLRKSRYIWLKNQASLNKESLKKLRYLSKACPDIGTAYKLKEQYREIWENADSELCIELLEEWIKIA